MKQIVLPPLLFVLLTIQSSCEKDKTSSDQPNQPTSLSFTASTICTTYTSTGAILQIGTPYSHIVTIESSKNANFDYHFINSTGDNDTTVYATKNNTPGYFTIPSQQFITSNNSTLTMIGQGSQVVDSLNYIWSFYINPNYRSHDCTCKAKRN